MSGGLFLGGSLRPLGLALSFIRSPFEDVVRTLTDWRQGLRNDLTIREVTLATLAGEVAWFEAPWTTEVLFDCGNWTAYLNNQIGGW